MKRRIMIITRLVIFACLLGACDKGNNDGRSGIVNYRVKTVSGHNQLWGDFRMVYGYTGSRLDSIVWRNHRGEKTRMLEVSYNVNKIIAELDDIVCKVSADSAAKLDPDSIPYTWQTALRIEHTTDRRGNLLDEYIVYRAPVEQTAGEEYSYIYEQTGEVKFLYEYDEEGKLLAWRSPFYGDNRYMVKESYVYNGQRTDEGILWVYELPEWKQVGREVFSYNGDLLAGWQASLTLPGESLQETKAGYTYAGNQLQKITYTVRENGGWKTAREVTYTFDNSGRVTKIDYGNGEWEEIEYEDLPGNSDYFLLKANEVYQIPDVLGHLRTRSFVPVIR